MDGVMDGVIVIIGMFVFFTPVAFFLWLMLWVIYSDIKDDFFTPGGFEQAEKEFIQFLDDNKVGIISPWPMTVSEIYTAKNEIQRAIRARSYKTIPSINANEKVEN